MSKGMKFSIGLSLLGNPVDRFVSSGYKEPKTVLEMLDDSKDITGIQGIELCQGMQINENNVADVKKKLEQLNYVPSLVMSDTFCQRKYAKGSFSSPDKEVRKDAINNVKKAIDLTKKIDCDKIGIWLGQDGFDYCFQMDYRQAWHRIIDGVRECADYSPKTKICIEYKIREPRTHILTGTVGKMLLLMDKVERENLGVILDTGHLFNAYENPSESAVLLNEFGGRLFHVHLNDNWGLCDDDLVTCSVHMMEYIEFLYWLREIDYQGWYNLDLAPYREDGVAVASETVAWMKGLSGLLDKVDCEKLRDAIKKQEPIEAIALVRKAMFS